MQNSCFTIGLAALLAAHINCAKRSREAADPPPLPYRQILYAEYRVRDGAKKNIQRKEGKEQTEHVHIFTEAKKPRGPLTQPVQVVSVAGMALG